MTIKEITALSDAELLTKIKETKVEISQLVLKSKMGQLKQSTKIGEHKQLVARLLTVKTQRHLK